VPSEFELIARYFTRGTSHTVLGVGDDGALIAPTPGRELVVSTDMLVEGTHFLADTDAEALGWKCLAVNVSDLAAMGAQPRWATLAAVFPAPTTEWIEAFARGFFACADEFGIDLIGGDTTRGPRAFCVTIFGEVASGQALRRSGAQVGDEIWVSGQPGRAALGLAHLQGRTVLAAAQLGDCLAALHRPQPRVALGLALHGLATSAIDVSDGLLADLGHILERRPVAAARLATRRSVGADSCPRCLAGRRRRLRAGLHRRRCAPCRHRRLGSAPRPRAHLHRRSHLRHGRSHRPLRCRRQHACDRPSRL